MKKVVFNLSLLFFISGCLSGDLLSLSKEYAASIVFFDQAQKSLRKIYSDCEYDKDCFNENSETHIKNDFCPKYKEYNFVSESECNRAGQSVIDLVSGENELAVPIRNTAQDAHNNKMYELEQEKLKQSENQWQTEQQRQEQQRRAQQTEQQRQEQQRQAQQAEQQRQQRQAQQAEQQRQAQQAEQQRQQRDKQFEESLC